MKMEWLKRWIGMDEQKAENDQRHWYLVRRIEELEKRVVAFGLAKGGFEYRLDMVEGHSAMLDKVLRKEKKD